MYEWLKDENEYGWFKLVFVILCKVLFLNDIEK